MAMTARGHAKGAGLDQMEVMILGIKNVYTKQKHNTSTTEYQH